MDLVRDEVDLAAEQAPEALIALILERFHAAHRRELPQLCELARKVEATHTDNANCPAGLADLLSEMRDELEAHMAKEEQILFPTLLAGGGGCAPFAIRRMRMEHEDHGAHLMRLRRQTNDFSPPEGACGTWAALYTGCAKLERDLLSHIELENTVLFPMFE
jgi:regulator of cell morphogenesis and NO signaling